MKKKLIIGLTGPNASGKGAVAEYLKEKGFAYHSLSDIIRDETRKLRIKPTRENLIRLGNELRKNFGPGILAKSVKHYLDGKREIVDSIRNPFEIQELRKLPDFVLLGIDAPVRVRFERSLERKRKGDAKTLRDFMLKESKENKPDKNNQQLYGCLKKADTVIINSGSLADLYNKIDKFLKSV